MGGLGETKYASPLHTNYFSFVPIYSCRILAEFKVNHYVCYCGTMNWITQSYILQQNGCYSIVWIPTYYIISNWMTFANCYILFFNCYNLLDSTNEH